jgi:KDO2-lipid IV(A) lauroyltransferase
LAFHGIRAALGVGAVLPRPLALRVFEVGGEFVHFVEKRGRARALRNLGRVYGGGGAAERLARLVYRDLGRNAVDLARLERMKGEEIAELVDVDGFQNLTGALGKGRGVVGITAHLGNWELLAAFLGRRGIPLTALASSLFDPRLDERLTRIRARHGVASLVRSEPGCVRRAVRVLRRGEMLGILMDLRCRQEGVVTDFLGLPTRTVVGPARLASRTGAPLLPMGCWMVEGGRYRIVIERPIGLRERGGSVPSVEENTRQCVRALESFIREAPTQWVWMHDRWGFGAA